MKATYITSVIKPQQLPKFDLPEIAFIGRSNTGKSSLLNALLGTKNLARCSRTPGRTRMANFFSINDAYILADLPGFGFQHAPNMVASHWQKLMDGYLTRDNIKEFLFLVDCRRIPPVAEDMAFMKMLCRKIPLIIVLTKVDKLSRAELKKNLDILEKHIKDNKIKTKIIVKTSASKKTGIGELRKIIFPSIFAEPKS